ncbi:MAG: hypothetical protein ACRC62_18175 [Microcoleus sp.]
MDLNLTIQDLKTVVLEHVSSDWVRENHGKLTLKATWQAAYDRLSETIAAKVDQATETAAGYAWTKAAEVVERFDGTAQYIQDFSRDDAAYLALAATAMFARLAERSIELLVMVGVFCWFLAIELKDSGIVDRTLSRMAELETARELESLKIEPPMIEFRSPLLASTVRIAS